MTQTGLIMNRHFEWKSVFSIGILFLLQIHVFLSPVLTIQYDFERSKYKLIKSIIDQLILINQTFANKYTFITVDDMT
jgi:hypothetical protein